MRGSPNLSRMRRVLWFLALLFTIGTTAFVFRHRATGEESSMAHASLPTKSSTRLHEDDSATTRRTREAEGNDGDLGIDSYPTAAQWERFLKERGRTPANLIAALRDRSNEEYLEELRIMRDSPLAAAYLAFQDSKDRSIIQRWIELEPDNAYPRLLQFLNDYEKANENAGDGTLRDMRRQLATLLEGKNLNRQAAEIDRANLEARSYFYDDLRKKWDTSSPEHQLGGDPFALSLQHRCESVFRAALSEGQPQMADVLLRYYRSSMTAGEYWQAKEWLQILKGTPFAPSNIDELLTEAQGRGMGMNWFSDMVNEATDQELLLLEKDYLEWGAVPARRNLINAVKGRLSMKVFGR